MIPIVLKCKFKNVKECYRKALIQKLLYFLFSGPISLGSVQWSIFSPLFFIVVVGIQRVQHVRILWSYSSRENHKYTIWCRKNYMHSTLTSLEFSLSNELIAHNKPKIGNLATKGLFGKWNMDGKGRKLRNLLSLFNFPCAAHEI